MFSVRVHLTYIPLRLVGFVLHDLEFYMYALLILFCPFVLFLVAIVLFVHLYRDSDYPLGIFKLLWDTNVSYNNINLML